MKVIKAPEDLKAWRNECQCTRCKAELEYEVSDIMYTPPGGDMRDSWPADYLIKCPVCFLAIKIQDSDLSAYIKHVVKENYARSQRSQDPL